MSFSVHVHRDEHIIEVTYPENPTPLEIADYVSRLRQAIDENRNGWVGLVDQRSLKALSPQLLETLKVMNNYAQTHGMKKLARVVPDAFGSMHAWRVAKEAALSVPVQTFTARDEAVTWLTGKA